MGKVIDIMAFLDGRRVVPYEDIVALREERGARHVIAQKGGQENALASNADIVIAGGNRGGGKTMLLLMKMLNHVYNPHFNSLILRKERDDLTDIVNKSYGVFSDFGEYKKSKDLMSWDFKSGGSLTFSFHDGSYNDFRDRFQGREYPVIGIDEITHITYPKFKYLQTTNRNSKGIRNQMIGTCNPDPDSWVATFIEWWIDEDGLPIVSRDGVLRYCFMNGDDVGDIIWGDTPDDVY